MRCGILHKTWFADDIKSSHLIDQPTSCYKG